jgi:hypothetical protein
MNARNRRKPVRKPSLISRSAAIRPASAGETTIADLLRCNEPAATTLGLTECPVGSWFTYGLWIKTIIRLDLFF